MATFGNGKIRNFFVLVKSLGGFKNLVLRIYRCDDAKMGKLVGVDKFGNKYYQNNYYFFGRSRWVIYSDRYGLDYDASQVPAEWYGWLHYKTDLLPCQDTTRPNYKWMSEYTENYTGTSKEYVPYSTTMKKIEAWVPPKATK